MPNNKIGKSAKSIFKKLGKIGKEKFKYINNKDIDENKDITIILSVVIFCLIKTKSSFQEYYKTQFVVIQ
ncbi:MAG: hypothetical protein N4A54_13060 [Peptostreptococcaceae bacterium]|nr:hypothetical protein [Peptostreptococcaceae bacterium]